jgi:HD superfamily phosphohydrolase
MQNFNAKRVSDPVHGTIALSELEVQIVDTGAFQRLRHIKQLGLAYYVFPGADYSRFAHSLGVCHITGRILEALKNRGCDIPDSETTTYRLAALLHDIGHYPFSHAMEDAIRDHYSEAFLEQNSDEDRRNESIELPKYFMHERVGQEILTYDEEIKKILEENDITPEQIYSVFMRTKPLKLANLVSSDMDADRIDYLLRTARHTGLPYGSVDIDYLLSQMQVDDHNRICLTAKALRTADHFLLSRYFDYQQVAYHKTVASFELVLKDVLRELLNQKYLDCSANKITEHIRSRDWLSFDEAHIIQHIRKLQTDTDDNIVKTKAQSILARTPPKLLAEVEWLADRHEAQEKNRRLQKRLVNENIPKWAEQFSISEGLWYLWSPPPIVLTKIGSYMPISSAMEEGSAGSSDADKYEQAIRILDTQGNSSRPLVELPQSLMHILSNYAQYSLRIYALLPDKDSKKRKDISDCIKRELPEIAWK